MKKFYRSRNNQAITGLCAGFAKYNGFNVGIIRWILILIAIFTAIFPTLLIYLIISLIIPIEPEDFKKYSEKRKHHNTCEETSWEEINSGKERDWDTRFHN